MKLLTLLALSSLLLCPAGANASSHKSATRITRDEAQHLALHGYPNGRVTAARLERANGHAVWQIEIERPHNRHPVHLSVDARSGRILSEKKAVR